MDTNEKLKQEEYYKVLLPDVPTENLNNFLGIKEKYSQAIPKKKYALNIPDVDAKAPTAKPLEPVPASPKDSDPLSNKPMDAEAPDLSLDPIEPSLEIPPVEDTEDTVDKEALSVLLDIEELKHSLIDLKSELRINDTKEEIKFEVEQIIKSLRKELEDLKSRKVPVRKEYDTEGAYKEQLYPQVVNIMDDLLLPLVNSIPEYNLLATQVSSTYDDGTIKNAIVSINVSLVNNDFKYDFKVDVPILNGLILSPQYMTRSRKIIPLTEEALFTELSSESFIKISPDYRQKDNMFSNVGENMLRKHDTQKLYPTTSHEQHSSIEGDKSWISNRQRGLTDER